MKSLKWILLTAALMVLLFTAVSGTLGDTKANSQYLGLIQSELMRSDSGLVDVTDTRKLLPAVYTELNATDVPLQCSFAATKVTDTRTYSATVTLPTNAGAPSNYAMYDAENVLDYIVVATNAGNTDGSVRTWFAFEMGDLTKEEFEAAVLLNKNTADWTWDAFQYAEEVNGKQYGVEINGQRYAVVCAKHNGEIPAGKTTEPSLLQVLLYNTVSNKTAERLDGDKDGNYEIMVSSRIISDDTAWGDFTEYPFPTVVTTAGELQNAINNGATDIILGGDINLGGGGVVIN